MSVLLLGLEEDSHIVSLKVKLTELNVKYTFIDISKDFSGILYKFYARQRDIRVNGKSIDTYKSIYWRYFPDLNFSDQVYSIKQLCEQQEIWNFFLPIDSVSGLKCVNPLLSNFKMENKIFQLDLAIKYNLLIPSTLISCSHEAIMHFYTEKKMCIEKNLGLNWSENNTQVNTRKLDIHNLSIKKNYPCIYQTLIKRKTELRIYVIGEKVIPIEISIPEEAFDAPDWRSAARNILPVYQLYHLSVETQKNLLLYHREANLVYAAYDFILNQDGHEVFLECNPNGNWHFLPEKYSNVITEELVKQLAES
jgi:glutathione synthase/RimK-type ligase-like ATP-grasp enzyme